MKKVFLISEILIFLMIASLVLTTFVFPLPANIELRMMEEHEKWSPRFWDNAVTVFLGIGSILTFFLSLLGITGTVKKCMPEKSPAKEIIAVCLMFLSFIVFCFFRQIPLVFGGTIIIFFVSLFRIIGTIKKFRKKKASVKEIIMFCTMIFNFIIFGSLFTTYLVVLFFGEP